MPEHIKKPISFKPVEVQADRPNCSPQYAFVAKLNNQSRALEIKNFHFLSKTFLQDQLEAFKLLIGCTSDIPPVPSCYIFPIIDFK